MAPPLISATPNPVLINAWGVATKRKTTITWSTGSSTIRGQVWLSTDGGTATLFDGDPATGSLGNKTPAPAHEMEAGQTCDFQLWEVKVQGGKLTKVQQLVNVSVRAEEKLGLPQSFIEMMRKRIPAMQGIHDVSVAPGIESVMISFRTRQPTRAFVELSRGPDTVGVKVEFLDDPATVHNFLFSTDTGLTAPLAQATDFGFRIVAPAMPGSLGPRDAETTGAFRTGSRTATLFFDSVKVRNRGEAGCGEFTFRFGAGDVDTEGNLGTVEQWGEGDVCSGDPVGLNRVITIPGAPPRLWATVTAWEDDSSVVDIVFAPSEGTGLVGTFPGFDEPGSHGFESYAGAYADVTTHFDLSDSADPETPFQMVTGDFGIAYSVFGRLTVATTAGEVLLPATKRSARPYRDVPRIASLLDAGDGAMVGVEGAPHQLVNFGPDGHLYFKAVSGVNATDGRWLRIGGEVRGPVTVVASNGHLSLFRLGPDGGVLHKTVSAAARPDDDWQALGGTFVGPIAAAVVNDGIELVALDSNGRVFHRRLDDAGGRAVPGDWRFIGSGVSGEIAVLSSAQTGLSVFARGREGDILGKRRHRDRWSPGEEKWDSLGAAPAGSFSAGFVDDDVVVLAVLGPDETVRVLPWRRYPDAPRDDRWRVVGTLDSLLKARMSLIKAPAASRAGSSTRYLTAAH
jgi:hypothetical protein